VSHFGFDVLQTLGILNETRGNNSAAFHLGNVNHSAPGKNKMEAMFVRRLQLFIEQLALTQQFGNVTTLRVWPAFEGAFGDIVLYRNCVASFACDFFSTCAKVFLGVQVKTSNTVFNGGCRWTFKLDTSPWMHSCLYTTWKNDKGVAVEIILIVKGEWVNAVKNGGPDFFLSGPAMNALANGGVVQKLGGALQLQSLSWQETVDKLGEIYNVQAFKANGGMPAEDIERRDWVPATETTTECHYLQDWFHVNRPVSHALRKAVSHMVVSPFICQILL
jgi:hypothetical protein